MTRQRQRESEGPEGIRTTQYSAGPTIASALVEVQGDGTQGQVRVIPGTLTDKGCQLEVSFGEPKMSKSGRSYLVTYDTLKQGALKMAVTVYIPLGKDKARRSETRGGDDWSARSADREAGERYFDDPRRR